MAVYLSAVWRCRYFWLSLVKMDLRTRYRGSAIGIGWSLVHPIAMTIILCTVFGQLFKQDLRQFAPSLMAGLTFWSFVTTVTFQGCQCFFTGESYIRQYPAPMAIYPLRIVLSASTHYCLALLMVIALGGITHGYNSILPLLSLLPTMALMLVFGWSLATLFGLANVRFRDTLHMSEIALQVLFYITPIMYPRQLLDDKNIGWILDLNPIVPFLTLLRQPLVHSVVPEGETYLIAALVTAVLATAASFALKFDERKLIFRL